MVGYENILETVHVIESIHRFLFLIFAYLVFLRFCCLKTDLMMCKLKDILYNSKICYIMYIYLVLDVKGQVVLDIDCGQGNAFPLDCWLEHKFKSILLN